MGAVTMDAPKLAQRMDALARANAVRFAARDVKTEISEGALTVAAALGDERSSGIMVFDLLRAQPRWGTMRARKTLQKLMIPERKRVDELTARQRGVLVEATQ